MIEYNILLYLLITVTSLLIATKLKVNAFIVYLIIFLSFECMEYGMNIQIWNQAERTVRCYDWFEQYLEKNYDKNKDYSEGIFNDDYTISLQDATLNKYKYIYMIH